jgi:multiple sugar transport system substrate-binding protein
MPARSSAKLNAEGVVTARRTGVWSVLMAMAMVLALSSGMVARETLFVMIPHAEGEREYTWFVNGLDRFKAANPEVEIRFEAISGIRGENMPQKLATYLAAGETPDVVMMMQRDLGSLVTVDMLQDLNVFLAKDPQIRAEDFVAAFMKYWSRDGKQLAMPINPDVGYIHYDLDLFADAGLPALSQAWPDGQWTWDDFRRIGQRLSKDTNGDGTPEIYGYSGSIGWDPVWGAWIFSNGGELHQPAAVEGLQFMADLRRDKIMAPFGPSTTNRRVAGMETLPAGWGQYHAAAGARMASFVHPGALAARKGVHNILGSGLLMFKTSRNPELAWALIVELMSHRSMVELAELTGRLPSRLSAFSAWVKGYESNMADGRYVLAAVESSKGMPYNPYWNDMVAVIRRGVNQVWQGQQPAKTAMESVSQQIEAMWK